jgi:hypothetical protein
LGTIAADQIGDPNRRPIIRAITAESARNLSSFFLELLNHRNPLPTLSGCSLKPLNKEIVDSDDYQPITFIFSSHLFGKTLLSLPSSWNNHG